MHRAGLRTALVTLLVLSSLLVYSVAFAAVTVTYDGETGEPGSGIDSYNGANADPLLWDYVYRLSNTSGQYGPWAWGILVDTPPESIWDEDGLWVGSFYSDLGDVPYDYFDDTALEGKSGVAWLWPELSAPATGTFHFRSANAPVKRTWVAVGTSDDYSGFGTEWSASPEPASMALTSLCLVGVAAWRRRRRDT